MKQFVASPYEMLASAWRHRDLILQMVKREVVGRYRGSVLGIVWSLFHPILMLIVYTFVFSLVFKARWGEGMNGSYDFAIVLFAGMIVFTLFAECLNRSAGLVLANPNYVKRVVFPLEVLPWVSLGSALFHALVSLVVLLAFLLVVRHEIPATAWLFPLVLLQLALLVLGLEWFLSSLAVYLRDVGQVVGLVTTVLMFLSPVFYPTTALPAEFRGWINLNPLAVIIEQARDVLIWGRLPAPATIAWQLAIGFVVACLGFAWFQRTRRGFADVL